MGPTAEARLSPTRRSADPDFVNLVPSDQFLDRYVFFADYTFPETSLAIVRRRTNGFQPVTLECAGELTDFQPLDGENGEFEYAWVKLTEGTSSRRSATRSVDMGEQEAHSDGPSSITVWGTGLASSYGYVAGMGLCPINNYIRSNSHRAQVAGFRERATRLSVPSTIPNGCRSARQFILLVCRSDGRARPNDEQFARDVPNTQWAHWERRLLLMVALSPLLADRMRRRLRPYERRRLATDADAGAPIETCKDGTRDRFERRTSIAAAIARTCADGKMLQPSTPIA